MTNASPDASSARPAASGTTPAGTTPVVGSFTDTGPVNVIAPHATRRAIRAHRKGRARRVAGPVASATAAAALVLIASFAHPTVANAQPVSVGTTIASSTVSTVGNASATGAAGAEAKATTANKLFERTAETADTRAAQATAEATAVLNSVKGKVDTTPLISTINSLANYPYLDTTTVQTLTTAAVTATTQAKTQAAAVDQAAADAAAAEAAAAAAAAQAAAEALAQANTPDGARTVAAQMASDQYGWGSDQFQCLNSLWTKESGWNYQAENASSGAYGIPQSLPGSKMSTIADDWATNAVTQISWGLSYIARGYGTPCSAWSHSQSVNWY